MMLLLVEKFLEASGSAVSGKPYREVQGCFPRQAKHPPPNIDLKPLCSASFKLIDYRLYV